MIKMMDEVNDARLLTLATKRLENSNITEAVPAADVYRELGISTDEVYDLAKQRINKNNLEK